MILHPSLIRAIVTACLANVPSADRQRFASLDDATRSEAEDRVASATIDAFFNADDKLPGGTELLYGTGSEHAKYRRKRD